MSRPIFIAIAGDSGAGKTTLTRGLVRILGEQRVTHIAADHYHRYDRTQRARRGLTPLHPDANHLDILAQQLEHLSRGEPVLRPTYRHRVGTFDRPAYVTARQFVVVEGMLVLHTPELRALSDARLFLDPPDDLRRRWKLARDCARRGYTTDEVLGELDRRQADAEAFICPQRHHADLTIAFMPGDRGDQEHLDAKLTLRPGVTHPALGEVVGEAGEGISLRAGDTGGSLRIPGTISAARSRSIQEAIWARMHFAGHLRSDRLGELTAGAALLRSEALAITQLLVLYAMVTAVAATSVGAQSACLPTGTGV